jgi:hypothetical protein
MKWTAVIACVVGGLAWPAPAAAHRLDEYLQATRVALAPDGARVEIDLTPGVGVASKVVSLIDSNGDGALSWAERQAYAELVVRLTQLTVDGTTARLVLVSSDYPAVADMQAGVGTIHLNARAALTAASAGPHELTYVNVHEPMMSAYLVNALAPPSGIHITDQQRDPWQHRLTLEYVVDSRYGRIWRIAGGLGVASLLMCALGWFRRSSLQTASVRPALSRFRRAGVTGVELLVSRTPRAMISSGGCGGRRSGIAVTTED